MGRLLFLAGGYSCSWMVTNNPGVTPPPHRGRVSGTQGQRWWVLLLLGTAGPPTPVPKSMVTAGHKRQTENEAGCHVTLGDHWRPWAELRRQKSHGRGNCTGHCLLNGPHRSRDWSKCEHLFQIWSWLTRLIVIKVFAFCKIFLTFCTGCLCKSNVLFSQ